MWHGRDLEYSFQVDMTSHHCTSAGQCSPNLVRGIVLNQMTPINNNHLDKSMITSFHIFWSRV